MQPCTYKPKNLATCGKICDAGQTLCPHHIMLAQAKADELRAREQKKLDRKAKARAEAYRVGARRR